VPLDHAFLSPITTLVGDGPVPPLVPIFVNCFVAPQPTPRRCFAFGQHLARVVARHPWDVAVDESLVRTHRKAERPAEGEIRVQPVAQLPSPSSPASRPRQRYCRERVEVELGVDRCRLETRMAEHVGDRLERAAG